MQQEGVPIGVKGLLSTSAAKKKKQQQHHHHGSFSTEESDAERELKSRAVMLARIRRHLEIAVAALVSKIRDEEFAVAKQCQEVM